MNRAWDASRQLQFALSSTAHVISSSWYCRRILCMSEGTHNCTVLTKNATIHDRLTYSTPFGMLLVFLWCFFSSGSLGPSVVKFNMEDSLNISESLSKDSQLNVIMTSPGENNVKTSIASEDDIEGEKTSFTENESGEQKPPDKHESLEVENGTDMLDPVSREEKTETRETSSGKLNELTAEQQFTTETPNRNSLESEEHENLLINNIEQEESAPIAKEDPQETDTPELSHTQSEINSSQKSSPVDHDHGSHRSPDRKSKDEYRKIKSEVTGEGETSESEGEEKDSDQSQDTWMDILGNGLLKKRVMSTDAKLCTK